MTEEQYQKLRERLGDITAEAAVALQTPLTIAAQQLVHLQAIALELRRCGDALRDIRYGIAEALSAYGAIESEKASRRP